MSLQHDNQQPTANKYLRVLGISTSSSAIKLDLVAAVGEFLGTFIFLLVGLGGIQAANTSNANNPISTSAGQNNSVPNLSSLMYVSTSMGLSLLFSCWIFFRATGAAFNPNISFALLLIRIISPVRFVFYTTAQLLASIAASAVLDGLIPGGLTVSTTLGAGTSQAQGLFIETFITCALVLSVLFLAVEKHRATFLAPLGIGLTLFAGHLFAVVYTGAGMNTARSFGPSVIIGFSSEHWIYWVGPTLGSLLAVGIYAFMKLFRYWKFSEGQDTDVSSKSPDLFTNNNGNGNINTNLTNGNAIPIRDQDKETERSQITAVDRARWPSLSEPISHQNNSNRADNIV